MHKLRWSQTVLPAHGGDGWSLWRNGKPTACADIAPITELVETWLPQNPVLVGVPGATRFVPLIGIDRFRDKVRKVVARNLRNMVVMFAVSAVVLMIFALAGNRARLAVVAAFVRPVLASLVWPLFDELLPVDAGRYFSIGFVRRMVYSSFCRWQYVECTCSVSVG